MQGLGGRAAPLTKAIFSLSQAEPLGTRPGVIFVVWERQSVFYGGDQPGLRLDLHIIIFMGLGKPECIRFI